LVFFHEIDFDTAEKVIWLNEQDARFNNVSVQDVVANMLVFLDIGGVMVFRNSVIGLTMQGFF